MTRATHEPAAHPDGLDRFGASIARGARNTLIALGLVAVLYPHCGCGPARNGLASVTRTVPPATPCTDGAQRCAAGVPETCRTYDDVTRWWPLTPLDGDGGPARCAARCVVDGEPLAAHCAGPVNTTAPGVNTTAPGVNSDPDSVNNTHPAVNTP